MSWVSLGSPDEKAQRAMAEQIAARRERKPIGWASPKRSRLLEWVVLPLLRTCELDGREGGGSHSGLRGGGSHSGLEGRRTAYETATQEDAQEVASRGQAICQGVCPNPDVSQRLVSGEGRGPLAHPFRQICCRKSP